ncbi:hypothetical protein E2562_035406 [Oryza meyeriana var. granulata]|uniref:WEB family protein n=1 Tax=Oryza meyeriana var. granulata TaxID=110450 RepID=A0A6G1F1W5_9ORYZ|nr:hypothetical protein E2562_035406 [Oryza meyeriana var. granulata]
MQQASKPKAHHVAPRVSRLQVRQTAATASTKTSSSAASNNALDKSSMDIPKPSPPERRSFKAAAAPRATTPDKVEARGVAAANARASSSSSELQAQLNAVQDDLKNAREHLAAIDRDKAQLLHDLSLTRRLADDAYAKLDLSLAAQRAAEDALELERFKSLEREQLAIDLTQRKEQEWNARCDAIDKRRAELASELDRVKDELAMAVQIADANAAKLESEASGLRAELQNAEASRKEELGRAEQLLHGLKVDIAYAKRAEADANQSAQEWKTKAQSLQARLDELSSLNKSNEDSLASLTSSFEECKSMLQHEQSQVVQLKEKVASLEKEACEYKEGFLETNRRLDIATKEAHQLQATIDRLSSEHKLLSEAHQQVVTSEKTVSTQVGMLSHDKIKLQQELDGARDERDKAKKAVEDLAAALRVVSSEAREAKERVLAKQAELDSAQIQISELKAEMKNAQDRYQSMLDESSYEVACLKKTVEKLGSEAKISQDEWASKEAGFVEMIKRSDEGMSSVKSEMSSLMVSLGAAEKQVQELKAERTQLLDKLEQFELSTSEGSISSTSVSVQQTADESGSTVHLKDLLSIKENEVLALNNEVTDLRLREMAALAKASELSKLLAEATARKAEEEEAAKGTEKSKVLLMKLEMDTLLGSLKAAEHEANAAKDDKVQLQTKLMLLESKITEANLTAEEEKISSLRLKETLVKEKELVIIARENDSLRTREAAAQAKIDELSSLVAETATARKLAGEYSANGVAIRSPEKQHNMFLKMICSPMDNVRDDVNSSNRRAQEDEIKHVEAETMKQQQQMTHGKEEASAVEVNILENSKIIENDISKHRDDDDIESSDDDEIESQGDDAAVDQMNGLLIHGPTSSFNKEQHGNHKKKKALLKKFGSLLKKKAHFTKLNNHAS